MLVLKYEMLSTCPRDGSRCIPQDNGGVMGPLFSWHSSLSGGLIQGDLCRDKCPGIWVARIRYFQRELCLAFMVLFFQVEKKKIDLGPKVDDKIF